MPSTAYTVIEAYPSHAQLARWHANCGVLKLIWSIAHTC